MANKEGHAVGSLINNTGTLNLTKKPYFNIFSKTSRPIDMTSKTTHKFNMPR